MRAIRTLVTILERAEVALTGQCSSAAGSGVRNYLVFHLMRDFCFPLKIP